MGDYAERQQKMAGRSIQSSDALPSLFKPHSSPANAPLGSHPTPVGHDFSQITIQPKLTVSQPNDAYEQEADRVAEQVMQMPEAAQNSSQMVQQSIRGQQIQRFWGGLLEEFSNILNGSGEIYTVIDSKSYIRSEPPELEAIEPKQSIPQNSQVRIIETATQENKKYSLVEQVLPDEVYGPPMRWGWTLHSNLGIAKQDKKSDNSQQNTAEDISDTELQNYEFKTHTADHAKKQKGVEHVPRAGTNLTDAVLVKAGFDPPSEWWSNFTGIQFLGKSVESVHVEFAERLKNAESQIVDEISTDSDYLQFLQDKKLEDVKSAKNVGKFLGIKRHASIRSAEEDSTSRSMHIFGLAIDINPTENPWVSDSSGKEQEFKKNGKTRKTKTLVLQEFLQRVGALFNQTLRFEHINPDDFDYEIAEVFDRNQVLDEAVERYFSLLENAPEKAEELSGLLQQSNASEWQEISVTNAKEKIQQDLTAMSAWWSRSSNEASVSEHGLVELDRRVVLAMGAMGLDWGGKYGDFMHFDMRNTGIGKTIQTAKISKEIRELAKSGGNEE